MTRTLSFMVYAHGSRVKAKLVKVEKMPKFGHVACPECGKCHAMTFIAEATQFGFFEDMHWEVYNCADCAKNVAFQYLKKQPLAQAVNRMK